MLTRKGKYGLKALVHLANLKPGEVTLVNAIAEANNIPKKFLESIMSDLRKAAIVYAKKGKGGGYALARAPEEIHIGHVIRVLDGPLAPIACASQNFFQRCDDCPDQNACSVRLLMLHVRKAIADVLDNQTLAELRNLSAAKRKRGRARRRAEAADSRRGNSAMRRRGTSLLRTPLG